MIIEMRCHSCGKPISHLWEEYQKKVKSGEPPKKAMDALGITRYCCRGIFLSHVDLLEETAKFKR